MSYQLGQQQKRQESGPVMSAHGAVNYHLDIEDEGK